MWTAGENASEGVVVGFLWGEGMGLRPGMDPGWETTGMQVKSALTRGQMNTHRFSLFSLDNCTPTEQRGNSCVELGDVYW